MVISRKHADKKTNIFSCVYVLMRACERTNVCACCFCLHVSVCSVKGMHVHVCVLNPSTRGIKTKMMSGYTIPVKEAGDSRQTVHEALGIKHGRDLG